MTPTLRLAKQAVNATAQITTLIEGTKEAPQWPNHIAHLEE
jgi:4'-phosphopantetheinyl transferase EntD